MAIHTGVYELDEPQQPARQHRRGRGGGPRVIAVLAAAALLGVGVYGARDVAGTGARVPAETDAAQTPPSMPPLDDAGVAQVRLGMSIMEYRNLGGTEPGGGRSARIVAFDYGHGCLQYESSGSPAEVVWVWVRDNIIVAVGVESRARVGDAAPPTPGASVFGTRLGQPVAAVAELPQRWSWGSTDLPRLANRRTDTGTATLADVDADGILDYARTATAAADDCDVDPRRSPELQSSTPGPATIDGHSLVGVSIGSAADDVTAVDGWFELGSSDRACRRFAAGHSAAAQALDGRVVALSADRLVEGPAVGDPLAAALDTLGLTPRPPDGAADGREVATQLWVLSDGRLIAVDSARPYRLHQELDRSYPVGEPTIRSITVGRPCAPI